MEQFYDKDIDQILLYISFFYNGGMNFELFFELLICPHKGTLAVLLILCVYAIHLRTRSIHALYTQSGFFMRTCLTTFSPLWVVLIRVKYTNFQSS